MPKILMTFLIEPELKKAFKLHCKEKGLLLGKTMEGLVEKFINSGISIVG